MTTSDGAGCRAESGKPVAVAHQFFAKGQSVRKDCSIPGCGLKTKARGWCKPHYDCWRNTGDPMKYGMRFNSGGIDKKGYRTVTINGEQKPEHLFIAERAIGRPLKWPEQVHHVNEVKSDNRNTNLVVCPDNAYHSLLHQRQRARDACAHADWLKCWICKQWGPPDQVSVWKGSPKHPRCSIAYEAARRLRVRAGVAEGVT